jgi:hypothetical protein
MILLTGATHFVAAIRVGAMTLEDVSAIHGLYNLICFLNEPAAVTDTTHGNSSVNVFGIVDSNLPIATWLGAYTCPALTLLWKLASVVLVFLNLMDCMECLLRLLGLLGPSEFGPGMLESWVGNFGMLECLEWGQDRPLG